MNVFITYTITPTVEGDDFVIDGPLYFEFVVGPGNSSCITVNITDDDNYEGSESFVIFLSNSPMVKRSVDDPVREKRTVNHFSVPEGPVIGSPSSTTLTVNDPEGIVQFLITACVYYTLSMYMECLA